MTCETKLTEKDVIDIKNRLVAGERQKHIAKFYDVCQGTISKIKNGVHHTDVEIDVDFVKYKNNWSYYSPNFTERAIKLYNDGYNQWEVAELMNKFSLTIPKKIRPKQLDQSNVNRLLKSNNVKMRKISCKYPHLVSQIKKLHKKGFSLKKIEAELGVPAATVFRYLTKKKVK